MSNFFRKLKACWDCVSWIFTYLFKDCVDLRFWVLPLHPNDLIWYAERVNGRLAMLTLTIILHLELFSHESIWQLVGVQRHIG